MERKQKTQSELELVVTEFIDEPPTAFYDIGVGPKTEWLQLSKRYPDMLVRGCEPHHEMYDHLKPIFPGELANVAISDRKEAARLYCGGDSPSLLPITQHTYTQEVEVWSLDEFDLWAGSHERILLWMDIEGSELAAIRSGVRLMASRRVRWINLEERIIDETVPGWCRSSEVRALLNVYGYRMLKEYNNQRTHRDVIYGLEESS